MLQETLATYICNLYGEDLYRNFQYDGPEDGPKDNRNLLWGKLGP